MPVYNCELYIYDAIQSVLRQTFTDFELIIIDDCSTDFTLKLIKEIKDERIRLITKDLKKGLVHSLNLGISLANGDYIARMDGDDICLPTRFEKQIEFLNSNPNIILCGTAIKFIGANNNQKHYPLNHDAIKIKLFDGTPFCHPTVMGRKWVFEYKYNENFTYAEDLDMWVTLSNVGQLANIDSVLLLYRVHEKQVSNVFNTIQLENSFLIRLRFLKNFFLLEKFKEEELRIIFKNDKVQSLEECKTIVKFFEYLRVHNQEIKEFEIEEFNKMINKRKLQKLKLFFNKKELFYLKNVFFLTKYLSFSDIIKISKFKIPTFF